MLVLPRIAALQRRLDDTLVVRGAIGGEASLAYARAAGELLDTVAELIESGHPAEARPLARRAVERITESLLLIDDSSGAVGAACQRALGQYAWACTRARPNAGKLAGWLFQLELTSPAWPTIDLSDFAEALGESGLAVYRKLVDEAWDRRTEDGDIRRALTLLVMRERLAKFDGDPDALVDVLPSDLPSPAAFLSVGDGASWLAEFLVQAYVDGGRGPDALELRRSQLRAAPTRERYARLRETALRLGRWPEVRSWALDVLSGAELVGALLDDGDPDAAWSAAEESGCTGAAWLEVARLRAEHHPADVLPGYRALVLEAAARTGRRAYREVVGLLRELRSAAQRCGRLAEFGEFLAVVRERHRRKSALLDELARAQLG